MMNWLTAENKVMETSGMSNWTILILILLLMAMFPKITLVLIAGAAYGLLY